MTRLSKQVIVIRKDLNMRKGKMCSQAAHASMKALLSLSTCDQRTPDAGEPPVQHTRMLRYWSDTAVYDWLQGTFTKITVSVDSEEALHAIYQQALQAQLPAAIIQDSGKTEFNGVPTFTAVAIGPAWSDEIDPITGGLPLL